MTPGEEPTDDVIHAVANRRRRTYLDAIDARRRSVRLTLVSGDLLRKPSTATQARKMAELAADLERQARAQWRAHGRRAFRGEVAVEIDLHALGVQQPVASPPAVKAYLDLLQGIAYKDDAAVGYLRVTRHANDNPLFRAVRDDWVYGGGSLPRFPRGPEGHVEVRIVIQPLRTYTADFDRIFDLRDELSRDDECDAEFFRTEFDHGADGYWRDELEDEARTDAEGGGLWGSEGPLAANPELVEELRRIREAGRRGHNRRLLLDGGPRMLDRPGPAPAIHYFMWRGDAERRQDVLSEIAGPCRFHLPLPPAARGPFRWVEQLRAEMTSIHGGWRVLDNLVGAPLALDIAVRSPSTFNARDLDNLARDVVVPFEQVYCADDRGAVASYRVYRADPDTGRPGVRVVVIGDERLAAFERTIRDARKWVLRQGPRRDDD